MENNEANTWHTSARENVSEHKAFLEKIKSHTPDDFYNVLQQTHIEVFDKTNCLECANCCKTTPALITNADAKRIARHLKITPKQFINQYTIQDINGDLMYKRVPCVFLADDHRCNIYEVRPEACRRYPHTDEREYPKRISLNLANTMVCPAAYEILTKLKSIFKTT
jgi:uncharacterized protein